MRLTLPNPITVVICRSLDRILYSRVCCCWVSVTIFFVYYFRIFFFFLILLQFVPLQWLLSLNIRHGIILYLIKVARWPAVVNILHLLQMIQLFMYYHLLSVQIIQSFHFVFKKTHQWRIIKNSDLIKYVLEEQWRPTIPNVSVIQLR